MICYDYYHIYDKTLGSVASHLPGFKGCVIGRHALPRHLPGKPEMLAQDMARVKVKGGQRRGSIAYFIQFNREKR